jgi:predicted ATP-dependent serine protease
VLTAAGVRIRAVAADIAVAVAIVGCAAVHGEHGDVLLVGTTMTVVTTTTPVPLSGAFGGTSR